MLSNKAWHRTPGWDDGYRMHYEKPWRRLIFNPPNIGRYEYATEEEMAQIALKEKFDAQ